MRDDASEHLRESEIVELYRALGDDYASYGVKLPAGAPDALREGYRAGIARHARRDAPDRFVRKWLQFRHQALARSRAVSEDVTVDFLRSLDVPVCPVTLLPLTYGERKASDWSIDRLNNNGAYGIGNLAIMSTHANRAKGAKTLTEVRELSRGTSTAGGLTPREWARMEATMYGPCIVEGQEVKRPVRQVAPIPANTIGFPPQLFQDLLVRLVQRSPKEPEFLSIFLEDLPNNQLRGTTRRMIRLIQERAHALATPYDVWFDDDLFQLYKGYFEYLDESTQGEPLRVIRSPNTHRPISERILGELRFKKRGYLK